MPKIAEKLITAEEFARIPDPPDGSQQELVRGVIITMLPPGGMHGVSCSKVNRRIGNFVEEKNLGTVTANDTGFVTERNPDSVRGPDVAFWSRKRLSEIPLGYIEVAPDLAVEVLSPSNPSKKIRTKLKEYFEKGVSMVWIVAPEDRTVTVYRSSDEGRLLHENADLSGEEILPGFSCKVADLLP
ncbi:MAG: Uma2 family endonuclease [Planctomycetes bacterium]|nr:Uma2 family endonuclease [Planctomycetota bacterium]